MKTVNPPIRKSSPGPYSNLTLLDITAFANALHAPDTTEEDFITALNDWKPVKQKIRRKKRKQPRRGKDETREGVCALLSSRRPRANYEAAGFVYTLLKWPLLVASMGWILILS